MKINKIYASGMEMTDAIHSYANEKILSLSKLTKKYKDATCCDIEVGKVTDHHNKGEIFKAEVNLEIPGGLLRAEATADDLYAAIDKVKDELKRQLVRQKNKRQAKTRKGQKIWKRLTSVSWLAKEDDE